MKEKEKKSLHCEAFPPCRETWLMGALFSSFVETDRLFPGSDRCVGLTWV